MQSIARSFVLGFISLFDLAGVIYGHQIRSLTRRSDEDALRSDWYAVGDDLYRAFATVQDEAQAKTSSAG